MNVRLVVIGDGPARVPLERQAEAAGLGERFVVTGLVDRQDVAARLVDTDILLQPDVVPYASPLKLFEYMAAGKAILAIDSPNIREILEDGENALLYDADVEGHFERQLERLIGDAELREAIGEAARRRIVEAGFLWMENARKVERIAERLVA